MLSTLKELLGLEKGDTSQDRKLLWLLDTAEARLKLLLGGVAPPDEMEYIVIEVAIIRFNRIGSEGLSAHTVEGENQTFADNDFSGFMDEIEAYRNRDGNGKKGGLKFL